MAVLDGEDEGAHAVARHDAATGLVDLDRFVGVHAGFEQCASGLDATFAGGEEQWGETGLQTRMHVGAGLDEARDDVGVAFGGGPHEGSLTLAVGGIDFCAGIEQ